MDDQCCNGHCNQGRDCTRNPAKQPSYWLLDAMNKLVAVFFAALSAAAVLAIVYLFSMLFK